MFLQKDEWNNNFEDEVKKARSPALVSAGGSRYDAAQRDAVADDAQKKFGGTKGISSDMYFGLVLLKNVIKQVPPSLIKKWSCDNFLFLHSLIRKNDKRVGNYRCIT